MEGKCYIYKLENVKTPGLMPYEKLVLIAGCYYEELTVGVTRAYLAKGANQKIDMLIRCFNITLPKEAEYVILEDGEQYRIELKQKHGDSVDLTLVRLEDYLDVHTE